MMRFHYFAGGLAASVWAVRSQRRDRL